MAAVQTSDFIFKVCLVGDPEVGKTSLVRRYVLDQFDDNYILTIGAKVMKKTVVVNHEGRDFNVTLLLWDIMGQKHYKIIESVALENVVGGLVVCDRTRKPTFKNLSYWIDAIWKISPGIPLILLGNKSDLQDQLEVAEEEMGKLSENHTSTWYMTSAKTGNNVETAFQRLAEYCLRGVNND